MEKLLETEEKSEEEEEEEEEEWRPGRRPSLVAVVPQPRTRGSMSVTLGPRSSQGSQESDRKRKQSSSKMLALQRTRNQSTAFVRQAMEDWQVAKTGGVSKRDWSASGRFNSDFGSTRMTMAKADMREHSGAGLGRLKKLPGTGEGKEEEGEEEGEVERESSDSWVSKLGRLSTWAVLAPQAPKRVAWDLATVVLLVYISLVTPVRVGFDFNSAAESFGYYFEYAIDFFFIADLFVNFRTGVTFPDGSVEMRPPRIARSYLRGYFLIDFVSSIPIDLILSGLENLQSAKVLKTGKILKVGRILKLAKLARLLKMPHLMERFEDDVRISPVRVKLLRIFGVTSLIAHLNACGWGFVAGNDSDPLTDDASWMQLYGVADDDVGVRYLAALYWSVSTITTVGYGDIVPATQTERFYALLSMISAGGAYAYVIATLSSIVTNQDANQRLVKERMDSIATYMRIRKFPKQLTRRVRKYYKHYYEMKTALDESTILQELSPGLRSEVAVHLMDEALLKNKIFEDLSAKNFTELIAILFPLKVDEGEWIFHAGDEGEEMFILVSGTLDVVTSAGSVVAVLTAGSHFGELCALGVTKWRSCGVRATGPCELYTLSKNDFFDTFAETQPETIANMIQAAMAEYEEFHIEAPRAGPDADLIDSLPEAVHNAAVSAHLPGSEPPRGEEVGRPEPSATAWGSGSGKGSGKGSGCGSGCGSAESAEMRNDLATMQVTLARIERLVAAAGAHASVKESRQQRLFRQSSTLGKLDHSPTMQELLRRKEKDNARPATLRPAASFMKLMSQRSLANVKVAPSAAPSAGQDDPDQD